MSMITMMTQENEEPIVFFSTDQELLRVLIQRSNYYKSKVDSPDNEKLIELLEKAYHHLENRDRDNPKVIKTKKAIKKPKPKEV